MKSKLLTLLLFVSLSAGAQSYFQKLVGGNLGDNIVIASTPNAYYLLHNMSTPDFVTELLKFDLYGNYMWGKTYYFSFGAANNYRIFYENNALYVTGGHQNNGYKNYYAKLDLAGNVTWIKELNYNDINVNTRILSFNGGNLLVGHRDYIGSAPDYTYDITLTQMDASGNVTWGKAYGDDSYDFLANSAVITSNGEIMVAGNYGQRSTYIFSPMLARFDASGNLLWMKTFNDSTGNFTNFRPSDITKTSDGNYVLIGYSDDVTFNKDVHIIKFNDQGNILWSRCPSQAGANEYGKAIIEDSQHNLAFGGVYNFSGLYGDFIGKFDLNGNFQSAVKIEKTLDSPFLFNAIYNGLGQDLVERTGFGYAYSTVFTTTNFSYKHCLITTDYNGLISCTSLSNAYPFTVQNESWAMTTFSVLPAALTNISGTSITILDSAKTYQAYNLCQLVTASDMKLENNFSFEIYPNPASNSIYVKFDSEISGKTGWFIYDSFGREIKNAFGNSIDKLNGIKIDLENLSTGIYYIQISDEKYSRSQKFVVR